MRTDSSELSARFSGTNYNSKPDTLLKIISKLRQDNSMLEIHNEKLLDKVKTLEEKLYADNKADKIYDELEKTKDALSKAEMVIKKL